MKKVTKKEIKEGEKYVYISNQCGPILVYLNISQVKQI